MNCDICGKKGNLYNVELEGAMFIACDSCSLHGKKHGKVFDEKEVQESKKVFKKESVKSVKEGEPVLLIVSNYNVLIKNKRERLNLKQEELAKLINEKESLIQQIESKKIEPSIKVAEKLENFLKIKLRELYKPEVQVKSSQKEQGPVTLGDVINIKTRKRK